MSRAQEPALRKSASDPQSLGPRLRAMARWVCNGVVEPKLLGEKFGLTSTRVIQITNSPLFKAEVKRLESRMEDVAVDMRQELNELTGKALENIAEDLYQQERSAQRTKVSFGILDRMGFAPRQDSGGPPTQLQINFFAPRPGDDPEAVEEHLKKIREQALDLEKGKDYDF